MEWVMGQRVALGLVSALVWGVAIAAPAAAVQRFNLFVTGELVQQPSGNPVLGLPFGTGSTLTASWDVDLTNATRTSLPPTRGTGTAASFGGVISNGFVGFASETAVLLMVQNANSLGTIVAIDNGSTPTPPGGGMPLRFDQLTLSDGVLAGPSGLIGRYDLVPITDNIPEGLFLSSLFFGRNMTAPTDPDLLSTTETIDPFSVWPSPFPGSSSTFSLEFRQGTASTPQEFAALPSTRFSLRNASVTVTETSVVPEPSSWAMLIAGFALVGGAARRQRRMAAA
jgi:hypothetical protein